jgi:hypothetical protein
MSAIHPKATAKDDIRNTPGSNSYVGINRCSCAANHRQHRDTHGRVILTD